MKFESKKDAKRYVKTHSPEFQKKLQIVPFLSVQVVGDVEGCTADDIQFITKKSYTVVLNK